MGRRRLIRERGAPRSASAENWRCAVADWWRAAAEAVWLPTAAEMADLDARATSSGTIPERALIENAGREVARQVQLRWPEGPVVALAGSGHNGADALVALRTLRAWGRTVRGVRCAGRAPEPEVTRGWDIELRPPDALAEAAADAAVLLDGILGTGLSSAPRDPQATAIDRMNASGRPIVAVDGPSGADFTTGAVPGACARATLTVCLGWPKLGLLRFPARARCGELLAVEIGFPPPDPSPEARAITAAWVRARLPTRPADAHKGRAGYLALVAGRTGMAGAAVLAARAAVRGGAGIVRAVSDPANRNILQGSVPSAIFVPWDEGPSVDEAIDWAHALVAGPGLGREPERRRLLERLFERREARPLLLDADGLNAFAGEPDALAARLGPGDLITPHPGELARLISVDINQLLDDPPAAARDAADRLGCVVLLKGQPSVVAEAGEPLRVSPIVGGALAAGGTGDVLSGLAGAYLAAGAGAADAAAAALLVSGIAASGAPAIGRAASDLPDAIPAVRAALDAPAPAAPPGVLFQLPAAAG